MDGASIKAGAYIYFVNARGVRLDLLAYNRPDCPHAAMGRHKILTLLKLGSMTCFWMEEEQGLAKAPKAPLCSWGSAFFWELLTAHSLLTPPWPHQLYFPCWTEKSSVRPR